MKRDAEVAKERRGLARRKGAQDAANDRAPSAPEIRLGDDSIGDITPRAAAHEDLRTGFAGAIEKENRRFTRSRRAPAGAEKALGEDGRRKPRRAGADNDDVRTAVHVGTTPPLSPPHASEWSKSRGLRGGTRRLHWGTSCVSTSCL